jgi:hypothetical protein
MHGTVGVTVPDELGRALVAGGLNEREPVRSIDPLTLTTIVFNVVGLPANVVIILTGKDDIAAFVKKLRDWMTHRSRKSPGSEFVLDASYRNGDDYSHIRVVARHRDTDQIPQIDTLALESLLQSLLPGRDQLSGSENADSPSL